LAYRIVELNAPFEPGELKWRYMSKHHASFHYLSGSEPYRGFRNMQSLLGQTVCYR